MEVICATQASYQKRSKIDCNNVLLRPGELTPLDEPRVEEHAFNVSAAYGHGLKEALLLRPIAQAVTLETLVPTGQGRWVYLSFNTLEKLFPYLAVGTIYNVMRSLKTRRVLDVKEGTRGYYPRLGGWYSLSGPLALEYASGPCMSFRVSEAMSLGLHHAVLLSWIRTLTSMNHRIGRSLVLKRNTILRLPLSLDQVKRGLTFLVKSGKVAGSGGGYSLVPSEEEKVGSEMRRNRALNLYA